MRESGIFKKMAGVGFGLSFFRTRIMHIMMCALLLVGGAFMLTTPTDVAAATTPEAFFVLTIRDTDNFNHYDPVMTNVVYPGTIAIYRGNTRVTTEPIDAYGRVRFWTGVPGRYYARVIHAPNHILTNELVFIGHFDGSPDWVSRVLIELDPINPVPHFAVFDFRFSHLSEQGERTIVYRSAVAIYRNDEYVITLYSDDRGFIHFNSSMPGNYSARITYAPGFIIPNEALELGYFDGLTPLRSNILHRLEMGESVVPPLTTSVRVLRFAIGNATFTDNGVPHVVEAAPFVAQGRTMVPLRAIVEAFGSEDVAFSSGVITFSVGEQAFTMTIGQALIGADGAYMGTPVTVSGRTFVPLRFIIDNLDAEVRWDGANQAAYIYIN